MIWPHRSLTFVFKPRYTCLVRTSSRAPPSNLIVNIDHSLGRSRDIALVEANARVATRNSRRLQGKDRVHPVAHLYRDHVTREAIASRGESPFIAERRLYDFWEIRRQRRHSSKRDG